MVLAVSRARRAIHATQDPHVAPAIMPATSSRRAGEATPSRKLEVTTATHSTGITSDSHHRSRRMRRSIDDGPWIASAGRNSGPDPAAAGGSAGAGALSAPTTVLACVANRATGSEDIAGDPTERRDAGRWLCRRTSLHRGG